MALMSCTECGRDVSTQAAACPSCGAPVPRAARTALAFKVVQLLGVVAMGAGVAGVVATRAPWSITALWVGALVYGVGRVSGWLASRGD